MIDEDLYLFVDKFGTEIVFTLKNGDILDKNAKNEPLKGIFDASYASPELGNMIVISDNPVLTCVPADVVSVAKGDSVTVLSEVYKVISNRPDGTGMKIIELSSKC